MFAICDYAIPNLCQRSRQLKRILNNNTIANLKLALNQHPWQKVLDQSDVNLAYDIFMYEFQSLLNQHCPLRRVDTGLNRHTKPWFTKGLRKSCKKKTRLYKIFLSCRTITAEARYKSYKNRLT